MRFLSAFFSFLRSFLILDIFSWLFALIVVFALICFAYAVISPRR